MPQSEKLWRQFFANVWSATFFCCSTQCFKTLKKVSLCNTAMLVSKASYIYFKILEFPAKNQHCNFKQFCWTISLIN